jgi:PKD repeat protein
LTATISGGSNVTYQWDFGDGQTGSGPTVAHTYSATGTYTAIVTASNSLNLLTATTQVQVVAPGSGDHTYYLPFLFKNANPGPDLVIESLNASSSSVTLTLKNIGDAPTTKAFWVDVYFNPAQTPKLNKPWDTIAPHGAVWGVTETLDPGESLTLTSGDAYYFATASSASFPVGAQVYALPDSVNHKTSYGNVQEGNEDNNLFGPIVSTASSEPPSSAQAGTPPMKGLPQR